MRLYCEDKQSLYDLQTKAAFAPLMNFLLGNPNCTLRQLTAEFPEKSFIKYLESCIQVGWFKRENRRYSIALPIYGLKEYQEGSQSLAITQLRTELMALAPAELATVCQNVMSAQPERAYFVNGDFPLGTLHHGGLPCELQVFSISTQENSQDLAGFFEANRHLAEPVVYQKLRELIGDVDEEYYFQQVQWILSRVIKERPQKASIFLESLKLTGVLAEEKLQVPYLRRITEKTSLIDKITGLNYWELTILLGSIVEKEEKGLFQWFYKEK